MDPGFMGYFTNTPLQFYDNKNPIDLRLRTYDVNGRTSYM